MGTNCCYVLDAGISVAGDEQFPRMLLSCSYCDIIIACDILLYLLKKKINLTLEKSNLPVAP